MIKFKTNKDIIGKIKQLRNNNKQIVIESIERSKKDMSMNELLKITRKLVNEGSVENKKTIYDQKNEEEKFKDFLGNLNVNVKFIDIKIYDKYVIWGGTVDGMMRFLYIVTPDDRNSGVRFDYLDDFSPDNPENQEIIKKIESYYDEFYEYWSNNLIQD